MPHLFTIKIFLAGITFGLFIIDGRRIIKGDPIRQEWVSFIYLIFYYLIFRLLINPSHIFSKQHLITLLLTSGFTLFHICVTVINYWLIYVRHDNKVIFLIIAWGGITGLIVFNLYLVFFKL